MTTANIILVLGQSNAVGYATNGVAYPGGWVPGVVGGGAAEAIWNTGAGWLAYTPGVTSTGIGDTAGQNLWGPEASIGIAKRAVSPQVPTYIIKVACGGVGMALNNSVNNWSPFPTDKMFHGLVNVVNSAFANMATWPITPIISECYWIGNESDCDTWEHASSIAHDLPVFITKLRTSIGMPSMKFIIARTKTFSGYQLAYVDIVRAAQMSCAVCVPYCAWVDTDDLAAGNVNLGHYDPASVVTLGARLAAAAAVGCG